MGWGGFGRSLVPGRGGAAGLEAGGGGAGLLPAEGGAGRGLLGVVDAWEGGGS